jgi:hypothetical protein
MPNYVYVAKQFEQHLKDAVNFVKRNEGSVVGGTTSAVVSYLLNKGVPHDTTTKKENIPSGNVYHEGWEES